MNWWSRKPKSSMGLYFRTYVFFDPKAKPQAVEAFCNAYGLMRFFEKLPAGLASVIGEDGINLSGGQKQLVSFARTLYHNPKCLLLDEFTGAMDKETEGYMLEILEDLKYKIPILIVTHKISPALRSGYVYILEDGKISIEGAPINLLDSDNLLSKSYNEIMSFGGLK